MFKQESYVKHKDTRLYIEKIKTKSYLKLKVPYNQLDTSKITIKISINKKLTTYNDEKKNLKR